MTLEMKSGKVTDNRGFFYYNEANAATSNLVYIYNALITGNDASAIGQQYTSYTYRTGAVYVCDMGILKLKSVDGLAAFDNQASDLMWMDDFTEFSRIHYADSQNMRGGETYELAGYMPGGGSPNYTFSDNYNEDYYWAVTSNPSQEDKDRAVAAATSIFTGNGQVIATNGTITFGHSGEGPKLPTPELRTEQGCDNPETTPTPDPEPTPEPEPTPDPVTPTEPESDEVTASIKLTKVLKDEQGNTVSLEGKSFSFTIEADSATDAQGNAIAKSDIPMPSTTTVSNDANGNIDFGSVAYTKPGTYKYKVTEADGGDASITYAAPQYVTVTVTAS